jgi:hypothetical protein
MSPVRDTSLMMRQTSDGDLTAAAALTALQIDGTPSKGLALQINCPTAFTGTTPILTVNVYGDTDASSGCTSDDELVASKVITAYGEYILPIVTPKRSIMVKLDVSGSSPNFGATEVGLVANVGQPWTRVTEFH